MVDRSATSQRVAVVGLRSVQTLHVQPSAGAASSCATHRVRCLLGSGESSVSHDRSDRWVLGVLHTGHSFFCDSDCLMQSSQNSWLQGRRQGALGSSQQIGQRRATAAAVDAARVIVRSLAAVLARL